MEFFIERFTNFFDNRFISSFNADSAESLEPGVYLVGTYYADKGITGNANFEVRYFVVNAARRRFPTTGYETYVPTLAVGENAFTITESLTGEDRTKDVTIYLFDTFTITTTTDQFSYLLDQPLLAEVSGGAWSQALPAASADEGRDLENQWGQTSLEGLNVATYWLRDPNSDIFYSDNTINFTWAPEVPIVDLDGSTNVRDEFTATSTDISLKYLIGGVVSRTPEGAALYTPEGALLTYGGTEVSEPFVQLTPGDNTLVVGNIADDFGNIGSTTLCPNVVLPPIIRYDGVTTLAEVDMATNPENPLEVYYDAPFTVYAGTAYEISSQVYRWLFAKGTYGTFNKNIVFLDSNTGLSSSLPISITFQFSSLITTLKINDGLVADLKFAPYYESVPDAEITPKVDTAGDVVIELFGTGTSKVIYDEDVPETGAANRRLYGGTTLYQRERRWIYQDGDGIPEKRYWATYNGTTDGAKIRNSNSWLPLNSSWTYHLTDSVATLGVGTLWHKGNSKITMDALGEISLTFGGIVCGVIGSMDAGILHFITLKYNHTTQEITVWYDAEVAIDAFDVSTAVASTARIVKHCEEIATDVFANFLDGESHHDRYYNRIFDNKNKDAFFFNPYFSLAVAIVGDSTGGGYYRTLMRHFKYGKYGDGDDIYPVSANYGGRTFYHMSVPDDYVKPAYVTGERPSLEIFETVPYSCFNVTHWLDRCMLPLYFRTDTQNWASVGYYEGENTWDEYIDALKAELSVCASFNAKVIIGDTLPKWASGNYSETIVGTVIEPTRNQIHLLDGIDRIHNTWDIMRDRYGSEATFGFGFGDSYANANATGVVAHGAFTGFIDPAHPYLFSYILLAYDLITQIDSVIGAPFKPAYTDPRLGYDIDINANNPDAIVFRDQNAGTVEKVLNTGTLGINYSARSAHINWDIFYRENSRGVNSITCDGRGGFMDIPQAGTNELWNSNEFTIVVSMIKDIATVSTGLPNNLSSGTLGDLVSVRSGLSDVFYIKNKNDRLKNDTSLNSIALSPTLYSDRYRGKEVVTIAYSAYMDGVTPKYNMITTKGGSAKFLTGNRSVEVTNTLHDLFLFAKLNTNQFTGTQKRLVTNFGATKDEIIRLSAKTGSSTVDELWKSIYYDRLNYPIIADDKYFLFRSSDFTAVPYTEPSTVLLSHWVMDSMANSTISDSVGNHDINVVGSPTIEDGGVILAATSNGLYAPTTWRDYARRWSSFSISFKIYVKTSAVTTGSKYLVGSGTNTKGSAFVVYITNNVISARVFGNGFFTGTTAITRDAWNTIAVTYSLSTNTFRCYVNNTMESLAGGSAYTDAPLSFLCASTTDEYNAVPDGTNGQTGIIMKDAKFFSGALTALEVAEL